MNSFKFGKYEYFINFTFIKDNGSWQNSLLRNSSNPKFMKMSYKRRASYSKIGKPNVTVCSISRKLIKSNSFGEFENQTFSTASALRSAVDPFNEFYGKSKALDRALNKVCSNKKKPSKEFRIAAWNCFRGVTVIKPSVKKNSTRNTNKPCGVLC